MFTVIRGGCFSKHPSNFIMQRPNGLPHYLFLIIKTGSELTIDGKIRICRPNSVLIIRPNTPYSYRNPNGEYVDDWLHFDCLPEDLSMLDNTMFHQGLPVSNPGILTAYIQQILWEHNFAAENSKEYYVDTLFKILLRHLCDDFHAENTEEYSPYRYKLQKLRLKIQASPYKKYPVKELAESFGISVSYFQYLYKLFFHVPFQADIIQMRIEYAKELIRSTDLPLDQIAHSCGYAGEVHFYRQFLSKTGMTPGDYRKTYVI